MHSRSLPDAFSKVDAAAAANEEAAAGASRKSAIAPERYSLEESSGPEGDEEIPVSETDIEHHRQMRLELQRRRYESRSGTPAHKRVLFVKWALSELASALPPAGKSSLTEHVREFMHGGDKTDAIQVPTWPPRLTSLPPLSAHQTQIGQKKSVKLDGWRECACGSGADCPLRTSCSCSRTGSRPWSTTTRCGYPLRSSRSGSGRLRMRAGPRLGSGARWSRPSGTRGARRAARRGNGRPTEVSRGTTSPPKSRQASRSLTSSNVKCVTCEV